MSSVVALARARRRAARAVAVCGRLDE